MPNPKLKALKIVEFSTDMRRLNRDELAPHFAAKTSGRIVLTRLMRSIIWQAHNRIKAGLEPPIRGNIRTFWYRFVKPVLAHIHDDDKAKKDPYDVMLKIFVELVLEHHLLSYSDFDFTDGNWENRRIGTLRPEVIVFAEKTGWVRWLRQVHETFSVTTLALGGAPSALSSEYTLASLKTAGLDSESKIRLIGLVDFDPSGDIIARSFQRQLARLGWHNSSLETLIKPSDYSDEELEMFAFELPSGQKTKTQNWLERTGGVRGKAMGLEAESMPYEKVLTLLEGRIEL
jgi:hypothetical protein